MVEEYKDTVAFEANAIAAIGGVYITRFNDYKVKVVDAYLTLNLHLITMSGIFENEEEEDKKGEEEAAKEGEATGGWATKEGGIDGDAMEVLAPAIATVEVLMEATIQADILVIETQAIKVQVV